jgi:hypothetical protein
MINFGVESRPADPQEHPQGRRMIEDDDAHRRCRKAASARMPRSHRQPGRNRSTVQATIDAARGIRPNLPCSS